MALLHLSNPLGSVITGCKIFSKCLTVAGIVAIATFSVAWMIGCNLAQSVGVRLPTVDVYRLEGAIPDYPVNGAPGEPGASLPDPDLDNAVPRGSARLRAVRQVLQAMATRRGALEQLDVRALVTREFEQYDSAYLAHKALREKRLDALKLKLVSSEQGGKALACSRRMITEAEWLLNYTAEWPKLDRQLAAIEHSLATRNQGFALRQTPDGSWGACYNAWFEKIGGTVGFLGDLRIRDDGHLLRLKYPFEILRKIESSEILIPYLYSLQLSQIAKTGIYNREIMNALEGALSQLLFKEKLRTLLQALTNGASFIDQAYVDPHRRFLDDTQDPILGNWGPWIMSGNKIIRTADLSQTYHTIAYRKGAVNYWPQIIETTLAIRDLPYPFGWRHSGQYRNHHDYDVVRILRLGWPHMTPARDCSNPDGDPRNVELGAQRID